MAEAYVKPEDAGPQDAQRVLDFLNAAKSAEELADAVEIIRRAMSFASRHQRTSRA